MTSKKSLSVKLALAISLLCFLIGCMFLALPNSLQKEVYAETEHDHSSWTAWGDDDNETTSLPTNAGSYVLTCDVTLTSTWTVPEGTTNLCLNGYVINANGGAFSVITVGEGATLNLYDCDTTTTHNGYVDSTGLWHYDSTGTYELQTGETKKDITGGIITGGYNDGKNGSTGNGGGVFVGGVFVGGNFTMNGGTIAGNKATSGGGVYVSSSIFVNILTGGTITDNSAENGGGVYYKAEACFAPGTPITMADGTRKAIETLKIGDEVRVFDHEKGEISSSEIFDVWTYPEKHSGQVKLHFSNDINITVVYGHSFFEREQNKYVAVTKDNVSAFVGHKFYNVDNERWETLEGYEFIDGEVDTYVITTKDQLNCVANGMLSNEDGFYTLLTNIFEYGDNLKIDQVKKEQDVAKFGLYDYENIKHMSKYVYDVLNFQYLKVAFGKGLITENEFNYLEAYYAEVDPELYCEEKEETPVESKSILLKAPLKAPLLTSSVAATTSGFYVGGSIKILGNNGGNLYISGGKTITIGTGTVGDGNGVLAPTEDMNIGITLEAVSGQFTADGTADYSTSFFSDSDSYKVCFNNKGTDEDTTDDYLELKDAYAITNNTKEDDKATNHGYIIVDKNAVEGEKVVVTVVPNAGWKLSSLIYNDGIDHDITSTKSFTMQTTAVSITATFVEKQTISISEIPYNCTYTGEPRAFQLTSGEGPIPTGLKFEYYVNGAWTETAPTNAGSYNVKITRAEDDTYKAYAKEITNGLVIAKAEQVIVINDMSKTYDANIVYANYTKLGDGTVTIQYKLASEDDTAYQVTAPTNAGSYVVMVSVAEDDNYLAGSETKEFTIAKASLTITANDKTIFYGDEQANNGVEYDGFVNNETEDVLEGTLTFTYSYEKGDDVGEYSITPGGLTSNNYQIDFVDGILTVQKAENDACFIHWILLGLLLVTAILYIIFQFIMKNKKLSVITCFIAFLATIVCVILSDCTVCMLCGLVNVLVFAIAVIIALCSDRKKLKNQ